MIIIITNTYNGKVTEKKIAQGRRNCKLQPIFTSKKIVDDLTVRELKLEDVVCQRWDANYIGYIRCYLPQLVEDHKHSVIGKHLKDKHYLRPSNLGEKFKVLETVLGTVKILENTRFKRPLNTSKTF